MAENIFNCEQPDERGYFGEYGGSFLPEELQVIMDQVTKAYEEIREDPEFRAELADLYRHYVGRPSPIFHAKSLSEKYGAPIYLKREDLNHTGAHKINHTVAQAILAKRLGKKESSLKPVQVSMEWQRQLLRLFLA